MAYKKDESELTQVINEKNKEKREVKYNKYVQEKTPKHSWVLNLLKAYLVGGIICVIGQGFMNYYLKLGVEKDLAKSYTTLSLVLTSIILTGVGVYPMLAKFAGAGTVVPITGFANSVASPAIEYKKEGHVFGIGANIFSIAGPVILYGIFSSWILGAIYYILNYVI